MKEDITFELDAKNVSKHFGGVKALDGATVAVQKGKLTALIGPNGSGKSTFFNVITGFLRSDDGTGKILFREDEITEDEPGAIAMKGMVRTFQHTRNFPKLTVLENLLVSPGMQVGETLMGAILKKNTWSKVDSLNVRKALIVLKFLEITHVADHLADELSGGQQKLLAIGRLLMTQPSLLLLDEPVAGVNPTLANKIFERILSLKKSSGLDILLIEHNMDVVMSFSDEIFVLADGKVIAHGDSTSIQSNRKVLDAYLGGSPDEA